MAVGFVNNGTIELTNIDFNKNAILKITSGSLENVGTIRSLPGFAGTGTRTIDGNVTNLGVIDVDHSLDIDIDDGETFDSSGGELDLAAGTTTTITGGNTAPTQSSARTSPSWRRRPSAA